MADTGRKGFTQKMKEDIKPDSEKSYLEKGKEFVTDKADKAGSMVQPEEDKGLAQGIHDSANRGKDKAEDDGEDFGEQAREYYESARSKVNEAVEYVSNKVHGGNETK